jgi:hypothetical protein
MTCPGSWEDKIAEKGGNGRHDPLDDEFPLGDGLAEQNAEVECPYCGEWSTVRLDPGSGARQRYVEDCPVCCRPWDVRVSYAPDGSAVVELRGEDEG